ncbi:MAG: nucleoside triphosphate pyrophosphohydrolase family protein [bacterium]|nr:nucleoside triphosphate pyrophosphohydrolase family protein [bacterium]
MDSENALTLSEYQRLAQRTDRFPVDPAGTTDPRLGPLLGLVGEIGALLAGYKKFLRDGSAYELFQDNVEEELGDILWYLANATEKFGLSLDVVAAKNLQKTSDRWISRRDSPLRKRRPSDHFDAGYRRTEQLPRTFTVEIRSVEDPHKPEPMIELVWKGKKVASRLGDNTYEDSGYRFHDAFHLANAAVLGWSPVARSQIFVRKRKSNPTVDAVEDGGRAIVIEEAIAALMFAYAQRHNFLEDITRLDFQLLKTFQTYTAGLEVTTRALWEVEDAVLQGFAVWRQLRKNSGGIVRGDLSRCSLEYVGPLRHS